MLALTATLAAVRPRRKLAGTEAAPDFALKSSSGENLRLSEYRGDVVMLSFWATWCGHCRTQMQQLDEMYSRYQDAGVDLLGSEPRPDRAPCPGAQGVARVWRYPGPVRRRRGSRQALRCRRMPVMVLIDRAGTVRDVFEGYRRGNETDYLDEVQALAARMKRRAPPTRAPRVDVVEQRLE